MDLVEPSERRALRDQTRRIAIQEFEPHEAKWDNEQGYAAKALRRLGELNLLGLNLPEEYGGQGLSHIDAAACIEEMGRISPDASLYMAAASLGQAYYIYKFGSEELRRKYLPRLCKGEFTTAIGITEPGAGTAATSMTTKATIKGDKVILNGHKHYVSNATNAGVFIIYGRMSDAPGARGIGAVLLDKDTPGFRIERLSQNMSGGYQADLRFEDCEVPASQILGPPGAFAKLTACYNLERCGGAASMLGISIGAFDRALAYVQERRQFNRPIVEFQAVQLKIADMSIQLNAAQLLLQQALMRNPEDQFPEPLDASSLKVFTLDTAKMVTDNAIQLFGGAGYLRDSLIERRYRIIRGFAIAGGALDIHRTMIAGWLTGMRFSQWAPNTRAGSHD